MKTRMTLIAAVLLLPALPASAEMTEAEKQVYVMALDPGVYAVDAAGTGMVIRVPRDTADSVFDNANERETIGAYVNDNMHFTGKRDRFHIVPRWYEYQNFQTGQKVRFFKGNRITVRFVDGSTVKFKYIGFPIQCPGGAVLRVGGGHRDAADRPAAAAEAPARHTAAATPSAGSPAGRRKPSRQGPGQAFAPAGRRRQSHARSAV